MKGLNDHAPHAPPWWLISCGALELQSDTLAHQTPLNLSGTPLIAQCFIIVPDFVLVSGVLPLLHARECTMQCLIFPDFHSVHTWKISTLPNKTDVIGSRFKLRTGDKMVMVFETCNSIYCTAELPLQCVTTLRPNNYTAHAVNFRMNGVWKGPLKMLMKEVMLY